MRSACINLDGTFYMAWLIAGDLGTGKTLFYVELSDRECKRIPTADEWRAGLERCHQMARELKYEVTRVRGMGLIEEAEARLSQGGSSS
ncbi:hypothetical protein DN604_00745 [Aeromonas caviae]|nr:hypothetical protein DN604_00745 [Aeromonas caviae]